MVNYQNSKIYSIRSYQTDEIYIGSTTQTLAKRFYMHKALYKRYLVGKFNYVSSFKLLVYDDAYIELLEAYPCNSKAELEKREGQLIRELNCINKIIPGRTKKQYRIDNKDKLKRYRLDNKDKIKQYRIDNKDKILVNHKQWRLANKDKINKKYICKCSGKYSYMNKSRHIKTAKHRAYIQRVKTMRKEIDAMIERNNQLNRESELLDQTARDFGLI